MEVLNDPKLLDMLKFGAIIGFAILSLMFGWRKLRVVRRWWHETRWQIRVRAGDLVHSEDQADHDRAIARIDAEEAEAAEKPDLREGALRLIGELFLLASTFAVAAFLGMDWGLLLFAIAPIGFLVHYAWGKIHNPPDRDAVLDQAAGEQTAPEIPVEAILGFIAAAATIGLIWALILMV